MFVNGKEGKGVLSAGGRSAPFQITTVAINADTGEVTLTFQSSARKFYSVEFSDDLVTWLELADGVEGNDGVTQFADGDVPAGTKVRYYRVVEE